MTKSKTRFKISEEDLKEISKVKKNISNKIIALRKRSGLKKLIGIEPVISQDPNNPDEVKICLQITIDNGDGTFSAYCICDGGVSNGFCKGSSSPA